MKLKQKAESAHKNKSKVEKLERSKKKRFLGFSKKNKQTTQYFFLA